MARIKLQQGNTVANIFAEFISAKRAKGLVNKTIHSYKTAWLWGKRVLVLKILHGISLGLQISIHRENKNSLGVPFYFAEDFCASVCKLLSS